MSGQDSTPRAVVYHRVARDTPGTPGGQLEAVREWAEARGYQVMAPHEGGTAGAGLIITDAGPVTEHGVQMSGGGYHIRWNEPEMEEFYPARDWMAHQIRQGRHVYRRRIIVLEDWTEITGEGS